MNLEVNIIIFLNLMNLPICSFLHELGRGLLHIIIINDWFKEIRDKRELEVFKDRVELNYIVGMSDVDEEQIIKKSSDINSVNKDVEVTEYNNWKHGCNYSSWDTLTYSWYLLTNISLALRNNYKRFQLLLSIFIWNII